MKRFHHRVIVMFIILAIFLLGAWYMAKMMHHSGDIEKLLHDVPKPVRKFVEGFVRFSEKHIVPRLEGFVHWLEEQTSRAIRKKQAASLGSR